MQQRAFNATVGCMPSFRYRCMSSLLMRSVACGLFSPDGKSSELSTAQK
jgi:hypothetical protein